MKISESVAFLVLLIFSSCGQKSKLNSQDEDLQFKILLRPAFNEIGEIVFNKTGADQKMQFQIINWDISGYPTNTLYSRSISLSEQEFASFDSMVIQKTKIRQPKQWSGCCDGMPVTYTLIRNDDTSTLYFRSPYITTDSSGYEITKSAVDQLGKLYTDSVISSYLLIIDSYMDDSLPKEYWMKNRFDQLRKNQNNR